MKKLVLCLLISNLSFAQVAIEKTTVDGSGILDFALGTTKGIILPNVTDASTMTTNVTPGTLVYDLAGKNVKYYDGAWKSLNALNTVGTAPTYLPGTDISTISRGVIIGNASSTAEGVLVLESTSAALILPKISNPAVNVKSPVAGMICYDPDKKQMAVYNGKDWTFWK